MWVWIRLHLPLTVSAADPNANTGLVQDRAGNEREGRGVRRGGEEGEREEREEREGREGPAPKAKPEEL
uniref:Uncharacterized protein n=1 Tax=Knipowitschia caucasica TaxID=637954 RepID=A0AAV2J4I5_KNICA